MAALAYAKRGWPVLPIHAPLPDGIACSCGAPQCEAVGNHPATPLEAASCDEATIRAWWDAGPCNVAILTGPRSGVVALVVDHDGDRRFGQNSLKAIERKHQKLARTVETEPPTGGFLYLFADPGGVQTRRDAAPNLHVLSDGAWVLLPPSTTPTRVSGPVVWARGRSPDEVELAAAPDWLPEISRARTRAPRESTPTLQTTYQGEERNRYLVASASRLRREGIDEMAILSHLLTVNRKVCTPPLEEREVQFIVQEATRFDPEAPRTFREDYAIEGHQLCIRRRGRAGQDNLEILANFTASIRREIVRDDLQEEKREFYISGRLANGRVLEEVRVPGEHFSAMDWVIRNWGSQTIIAPNNGARPHLRAAIQTLSGEIEIKRIFAHSGWRNFGGLWYYLHASGAIGEAGSLPGVEVELEDRLAYLRLPDPPAKASDELAAAVRASLGLLDLADGHALGAVVLGGAYRAMLAEAEPIKFAIWLVAETGSFKSQVAALVQAHYGADYNSETLPANWGSTANAIERLASVCKDAPLTVDDFAPKGPFNSVKKLHEKADDVLRAAGNKSGRIRMNADGTLRKTFVGRGLILSTGEDIPDGPSLKARLLTVEFEKNTIDPMRLTIAQADARAGKYALAMSGFARWLAPRMDSLKASLRERIEQLRQKFAAQTAHRRTPDGLANLLAAWELWLAYARDDAGLTSQDAGLLLARVEATLTGMIVDQSDLTSFEEPAVKFLRLVRGALDAGHCHVTGHDGHEPQHPSAWGWTVSTRTMARNDGGLNETESWTPRGSRIGVIPEDVADQLYIFPEAAYAAAQTFARAQGDSLSTSRRTLWRMLRANGHLLMVDGARGGRFAIRRKIGGHETEVLVFRLSDFGAETPNRPATIEAWTTPQNAPGGPDAPATPPTPAEVAKAILVVRDAIKELQTKTPDSPAMRADILALAENRGVPDARARNALHYLVTETGEVRMVGESLYEIDR